MGGTSLDAELPKSVQSMLPEDPEEQLDIARKIAIRAFAARASKFEGEIGKLRVELAEKEKALHGLSTRSAELEKALADTTDRLVRALADKTKLIDEKNDLAALVNKLNQDITKLETFKKGLMHSLQEEDKDEPLESPKTSANRVVGRNSSSTFNGPVKELKHGKGNSNPATPTEFTPLLSPTELLSPTREYGGSHRTKSTSGSPHHHSPPSTMPSTQPVRNRRHSMSSSSSLPFLPKDPHSPPHTESPHSGGNYTRTDGKEFFRQARNRLSYKQFSEFLAAIKELNGHKQTKEETLRKADAIFGAENKDLYKAFDGLLKRHVPTH